MKKGIFVLAIFMLFQNLLVGQITFPTEIKTGHPRILTDKEGQEYIKQKISTVSWAKTTFAAIKSRVDPYVDRHQSDTGYIVSRLQMYWKTHFTNVYVQNDKFVRADGHAPIPTVRFAGARDWATSYRSPSIENIKPYSDSTLIYLVNGKTNKWEWADPSVTGQIIENINRNILALARDAAFMYWYTGEVKYAKFSHDIFKTYMYGMYYLNPPIDIGKTNTIIGLQTFEVIHDSHLEVVSLCYDFLYDYFKSNQDEVKTYTAVLKKWINQIIVNGSGGNWNIFQAKFISHAALALENNDSYSDKMGMQYYLDLVFNKTSSHQVALTTAINTFDPTTFLWNEAPGYSMNVSSSLLDIIILVDRVTKNNLLEQLPVLKKSVPANAQYLFPFLLSSGWGDTDYIGIPAESIERLISISRQYGNTTDEDYYTRLLDMQFGKTYNRPPSKDLYSLFQYVDELKPLSKPGELKDFASPAIYVPGISLFYQRNGFDKIHGLAATTIGKSGGHSHFNGISIELSGKGYALGVESGRGASYWTQDHAQYNSKYPAHNTVVVNGKSASGNAFKLLGNYPASQQNEEYFPQINYVNVYLDETTTNSDQQRLTSIIRTSDSTGYFIDIFRSRQRAGGDVKHEYFYHNQGVFANTTITDNSNAPLPLQPTKDLTSAGNQLPGYDYFTNEKSIVYDKDFNTVFRFLVSGVETTMKMWMKGFPGRKIYLAEGPQAGGFDFFPASIRNLTIPVVIVKQEGEAWTKPFVGVFEPYSSTEPLSVKSISSFSPSAVSGDFAGLEVTSNNLNKEFIFSSVNESDKVSYNGMEFEGSFGVISERGKQLKYLFLGNGHHLSQEAYGLTSTGTSTNAVLAIENGKLYFTSQGAVTITIPDNYPKGDVAVKIKGSTSITGTRKKINSVPVIMFDLPSAKFGPAEISVTK